MSSSTSHPSIIEKRGDLEVYIERVFDAPRDLVFRLWTDPQKQPEFWGPRKYETIVEQWDFKVGGAWRMINKAGEEEHAFYGEFREIVAPELIEWTFEYGGMPGHVSIERMTFEELEPGKTRTVAVSTFAHVLDRDGMFDSGMSSGVIELHERFDELLERERA
ncbi:MAG: polyketide cyclase [Thermoleophilia bacterium]|nr:polyketide cyclase [Thermoleophilia bacterium]